MNLLQAVAALIEEEGKGTIDSLMADLPDYSRKQITRALSNAAADGRIHRIGWVNHGRHQRMGVFAPGPAECRERADKPRSAFFPQCANSVFALGGLA